MVSLPVKVEWFFRIGYVEISYSDYGMFAHEGIESERLFPFEMLKYYLISDCSLHLIMCSRCRIIGIRLILPSRNKHLGKEALKLANQYSKGPKELFDQLHDEKREEEFIKTRLEKITESAIKNSGQIIEELVDIKKLIEQYGGTVRGRYLLTRKIENITPEEHQARRLFVSIQEMVKKLSEFDHNNFVKLKDQYQKLSHAARKEIHAEFQAEWHKIGAEKDLARHAKGLSEYDRNFAHAVSMVIVALKADKIKDAHLWIDEAIKWEKRVQKSFGELENLEKKIDAYTRKEIKAEKKEITDVSKARRQVKAGKEEAVSAKSL